MSRTNQIGYEPDDLDVTPEMIEAGMKAYDRFWLAGGPDEADVEPFLRDAFRSMIKARVRE